MRNNGTIDTHNLRLQLTIRVSHGSMSFSVGDPQADGQFVFEPYDMNSGVATAANLREAFGRSELLQSGYKNALALIDSPVMLVPQSEYAEEDRETLYRYCFGENAHDDIVATAIAELNAIAVFAINHDLRQVLEERFKQLRLMPLMQPVWLHLYRKNFTGIRPKLFAYFHDKRMEVFRFDHNRFRFANSFDATHAHDALYYLLFIWKQLGMDSENDELHIVGDITHEDWLRGKLSQYLQRSFVINQLKDFDGGVAAENGKLPYDLKALYMG